MKNLKFKYLKESDVGGSVFEITNQDIHVEKKVKNNIWIKLFTGAIIGFVNGFWGGGGGMVCVPLLSQVIKLPEKKAHATTLLIMLPLSIVSLLVYIIKGNMPWLDSAKIGLGFVFGGVLGAYILKLISNVWLSIIFSLIIIAGGLKILL